MAINFTFGQNFGRAYENALQLNQQKAAQEALNQFRQQQHRLAVDRFNEQARQFNELDADRDRAYESNLVTLPDGSRVSSAASSAMLARDESEYARGQAVDLDVGELFPGIRGGSDLQIKGASPNAALNALGIAASIANRGQGRVPDLSRSERLLGGLERTLVGKTAQQLISERDEYVNDTSPDARSHMTSDQKTLQRLVVDLYNTYIERALQPQRQRDQDHIDAALGRGQ